MPSTPRGRDAATALAVLLTIALALAWLRSSDGSTLDVPAGLSVGTVPAAATQPAGSVGLEQRGGEGAVGAGADARMDGMAGDVDAERRRQGEARRSGERKRHRAMGRRLEPQRARRGATRRHADRGRRDSSGVAPAPSAGSAGGESGTTGSGAVGGTGAPAPQPEFALG
jgi:hypothetical protein